MVCQDQPEERTMIFQTLSKPSTFDASTESPSKKGFLTVHMEDRPEKCIIDHGDVVEALVEQSLELIRRDNDDASLLSQSSDGFTSYEDDGVNSLLNDSSELSRNQVSFTHAPSEATIAGRSSVYAGSDYAFSTATAATTDTNATRQVRNRYDSAQRRRKRKPPKRPQVLGTAFHQSAQLQQDLQKAISQVSKKEPDARRLARLVKAIQGGQACAEIPAALKADPIPAYLGTNARQHMTILHLRIKPRFTEFYQSHLSRLLPDSPFTQAVSQGISLNKMSPPRSARTWPTTSPDHHHYRPPLTPTYSDSSSSDDVVEFGQGPPSQKIRLLATGSNFADLGLTGSLGLANPRKNHGPSAVDSSNRIKPPSHYSVLMNRRSGVPLAVCALKTATTGPPVVRIYVTKRRLFGQRPAATTKKLGLDWCESYPLYPWAEIVTEGRYPNRVRYSIFLAKGNDGRFEESPSYRAEHTSVGSPEIRVVGRTERDTKRSGCAVLSLCRDEGVVEEDDLFIKLSVAKGIDPALLICFAQVVDEAMEKTMRQQFASLSEGVYRRS